MLYILIFLSQILLLFFLSKKTTHKTYAVIFNATKNKKLTLYLYSILFLPGTYIHELSHALMARILFVPIKSANLIPRYDEEGKTITLGSVQIAEPDPARRLLIGAAPIYLGLTLLLSLLYFASHNNLATDWRFVLPLAYLTFTIGNTLFSSQGDLEGAGKIFVIFIIISALGYWAGIRVSFSLTPEAFENLVAVVKTASLYLSIPLIIDILVVSLLNKLS